MALGERIKEMRVRCRMTQTELASAIGVVKCTVTGYERNTREPDVNKLKALARVLHTSVDYLLDGESTIDLSDAALNIAKKYDRLDEHGRAVVEAVTDLELTRLTPYDEAETVFKRSLETQGAPSGSAQVE